MPQFPNGSWIIMTKIQNVNYTRVHWNCIHDNNRQRLNNVEYNMICSNKFFPSLLMVWNQRLPSYYRKLIVIPLSLKLKKKDMDRLVALLA